MMNSQLVHQHRISKSTQRLRRDVIELAAIIDEARDTKSAALAILDAGYAKATEPIEKD